MEQYNVTGMSCAACSAVVSRKDDMSRTTLRDTESGMVRTALTVEMYRHSSSANREASSETS